MQVVRERLEFLDQQVELQQLLLELLVLGLGNRNMKKLKWLWMRFWGRKYYIVYTDELRKNEVLFYNHKIYVRKE